MVGRSLNKTFGTALRNFISKSTSNRFKAMIVGALVAVGLQSSMATCVIVSSFVTYNVITVSAAIAVMLGADVGTSIAAQIMSLDLNWLMPVVIAVGYIIGTSVKNSVYRHLGGFFVGIGLVLLSLTIIRSTASNLNHSEALKILISPLQAQPALAVVLSVIITWMAHSSLGMVLLFTGFVTSGIMPVDVGIYMVLGANLGGVIGPVVMMSKGLPAGKRVPLANLFVRAVGVVAVLPFVSLVIPALEALHQDQSRLIVNFHVLFNLSLALLFIPFTSQLADLMKRLVPDRATKDDPNLPKYLEPEALSNPTIALNSASRETLRVSDIIQEMFDDTLGVLKTNDYETYKKICDEEQVVDSLYKAIKTYLSNINSKNMTEKELFKYMQILMFATNLEHIGDIIDKGLMHIVRKKIGRRDSFSREGFAEIAALHSIVKANLQLAQNLLLTNDVEIAEKLLDCKAKLREDEMKGLEKHIKRLSEGVVETIATSSMHMDVMSDMRRINSYASLIAYNVIKRNKEKLQLAKVEGQN